MCKPVKEYLGVVREYTRELVMFGGIILCAFVYRDFRDVVHAQAETSAKTAEILREIKDEMRSLDARASRLEEWHAQSQQVK